MIPEATASQSFSIRAGGSDPMVDSSSMSLKYNSQQPLFVKEHIMEEIERWKKEIIQGFKTGLEKMDAIDSADSQLKPAWFQILNSSIRLFNRYTTNMAYPLTVEDRTILFETLLQIITHKTLGNSYMELQTKLANVMLMILKSKQSKLVNIQPITCWRQFYEMLRVNYFTKNRCIVYNNSYGFGKAIVKLLCKLRGYFAPETVQEIINEFTPRMYFR